jgi:hypothetical protein
MAEAYAERANAAGHEVRRIDIAQLDFPSSANSLVPLPIRSIARRPF